MINNINDFGYIDIKHQRSVHRLSVFIRRPNPLNKSPDSRSLSLSRNAIRPKTRISHCYYPTYSRPHLRLILLLLYNIFYVNKYFITDGRCLTVVLLGPGKLCPFEICSSCDFCLLVLCAYRRPTPPPGDVAVVSLFV